MSLKVSKKSQVELYEELVKDYNTEVVGFIPARGGSVEIKDKNIITIAGYPLIAYAILTLRVAGIKRIYVSTDSKRIRDIAVDYGADVVMRPKHLAEDNSPTEDAIKHFYSIIKDADCVAMRQCTSPLLEPNFIRQAVNKFIVDELDSLFVAVNLTKHDMLLWNRGLRPINYQPKSRGTRQTRRGHTYYLETGGLYLFRKRPFIKDRCRICGKHDILEIPLHQSWEIDDAKDLGFIRKVMEK